MNFTLELKKKCPFIAFGRNSVFRYGCHDRKSEFIRKFHNINIVNNYYIQDHGLHDGGLCLSSTYSRVFNGGAHVSASNQHVNYLGDAKLDLESADNDEAPGPAVVVATVIDGTNMLLLARGDIGFGISHCEAFATWIEAVKQVTSCQQLYVVFDNKRGRSGPHKPDIRRLFAPNYLDNRHFKLRKKQGPSNDRGRLADGQGHASGISRLGDAVYPKQYPMYDIGELRGSSEALMDQPPPHLAGFVQVIRKLGGLTLYGLPGYEADDLIASLVAGFSIKGITRQAGSARGSASTSSATSATATPPITTTTNSTTTTPAALATAGRVCRVVVVSADSDMLQLLAYEGCSWLEIRQLSSSTSPQEDCPLAVRVRPLPGVSEALLRLHEAAASEGQDTSTRSIVRNDARPPTATAAVHQARLVPASYPDYLALVGKAEAGVPGVDIGARSAKKILALYGSIDGIVRAYDAGALDGTLRLAAGKSSDGPNHAPSGCLLNCSPGSDFGGSGGRSKAPELYPPAVRQALRNIQVTRMHADVASVPWERVFDYQLQCVQNEHQRQQKRIKKTQDELESYEQQGQEEQYPEIHPESLQRLQQTPPQGTNSSRPLPSACGSSSLARCNQVDTAAVSRLVPQGFALHAQDQLHLISAAPFSAALGAALQRRGLTYSTAVVDEDCLLSDIVVFRTNDAECGVGGDWRSGYTVSVEHEAFSMEASRTASGTATAAATVAAVATAVAAAAGPPGPERWISATAVEKTVDALTKATAACSKPSSTKPPPVAQLNSSSSSSSSSSSGDHEFGFRIGIDGASSASCRGRSGTSEADGCPFYGGSFGDAMAPHLRVCVLGPWDFKYEPRKRSLSSSRTEPRELKADEHHHAGNLVQQMKQAQPKRQQQQAQLPTEAGKASRLSVPAGVTAASEMTSTAAFGDAMCAGAGVTHDSKLLEFAYQLQATVGARLSLAHLPKTLKAALRPTTAWRVKRLQRRAGVMASYVAVVPFYELLEGVGNLD